jgi:hypothetical protein
VDELSDAARRLLHSLQTNSPARDREVEAMKERERSKAHLPRLQTILSGAAG